MISSSLISKALIEKVKESKDSEALTQSLISFLKENHLIRLLPSIILKMEGELEREDKMKTIKIKTSHEFSPMLIEKIKNGLEIKKGDKVSVTVEPALIGGFVVSGKNKILDASVKNNLKSLKESLIEQY